MYAGDGSQKEESASGVSSSSTSKAVLQQTNEDEGAVEMIRRYLAEKLGFYDDKNKEVSEEKTKVYR
jgi:hypothetical protein